MSVIHYLHTSHTLYSYANDKVLKTFITDIKHKYISNVIIDSADDISFSPWGNEIGLRTPICMGNKYFTANKTRYCDYGCGSFSYFLLSLDLNNKILFIFTLILLSAKQYLHNNKFY